MRIFNLLLITLSLTACNHAPINTKLSNEWRPLNSGKQARLINKQSQKREEYDGLHLSFSTQLTFLNSIVQRNNLNIQSQFKNWTSEEASTQKTKRDEYLAESTEFFLTFYSPNIKRNKLDQAAAGWKAVLKINGHEYEGGIKLRKNITHHNKVYYPNLNPWSTPYLVTFPVATKLVESDKFEVLVLGPEGMASFKY